jgi:hypothetical protein
MSIEPSQAMSTTFSSMTARPVKYLIYSQEQAFRHMTVSRPDKEQQLYIFTDETLFFVWDALSLSIDEENREVYFPYLPHVFDLLKETEDGHEICDYLTFIEETRMGAVRGDTLSKRRAWRVADLLLKYKTALFLQT